MRPDSDTHLPAGHSSQASSSSEEAEFTRKLPLGHVPQAWAATPLNCPLPQEMQCDSESCKLGSKLSSSRNFPAAQEVQEVLPIPLFHFPEPQGTQPETDEYEPAAHSTHFPGSVVDFPEPAGQLWHSSTLVAPLALVIEPSGQAVQTFLLAWEL